MPIAGSDETWNKTWGADLWWYLGLVAASGIAFGIGQGVLAGLLAAAGMLVFTIVLAMGRRRSDAVRVVGGAGDERNRGLYNRSLAAAGAVLGLTLTGWFLLGVAQGRTDGTLLVLTVLFAAVFIGAAVVNAQRG